MSSGNIESLDELIESLRGRPGLVYGPLATLNANSYDLIIESASSDIEGVGYLSADNLPQELDKLKQEDMSLAEAVEHAIKSGLESVQENDDVGYLVKAGWSMCISLTRDMKFEIHLQNYTDRVPSSRPVTIVDHASIKPETRTTPIYKLLGNLRNKDQSHDLVLAESDLLVRKNVWRQMLNNCSDYLHGNPIIFIGTDTITELVQELLGILSTLPPPAPNSLIFLKGDPTLDNPTVRSLCNAFSSVRVVDASLREVSHAIKNLSPKQEQLNLAEPSNELSEDLSIYASIVSIVPFKDIGDEDVRSHKRALVDRLFRPAATDWDPFLSNLDLERDCTTTVVDTIQELSETYGQSRTPVMMLRGEAGIGKTAVMKRAAIEAGKKGYLSLWSRRSPVDNWIRSYRKLAADLSTLSLTENNIKGVVLFVDDPWSLRLDPAEVVACFEQVDVRLVIVFSLRNSEYFNPGVSSNSLPYATQGEIEVPSLLSDDEIGRLPNLLINIGAVTNDSEAEDLINQMPTTNTDDILCSLWYLVPETREILSGSLKDEYHRLGTVSSTITDVAHHAQLSGESMQHAYEYVSVVSKMNVGLPMEVLVRSLSVSYEEFIDLVVSGRPLWGLIYPEDDHEHHTIRYRTRNEIVTRVLLELVNGGVGHAGEFRVLKKLLAACDIGSQVYRDFVVELLVSKSKILENILTYEQGLELFNVAIKALPHEDRLLEHHKGLWMQHIGGDFQGAYQQYEKALSMQQYPGARETYTEHIQTSMASSVVGLVGQGKQDPDTGLDLVREHIQQASNPKIFNAHTGHIAANLYFKMSQHHAKENQPRTSFSSLSSALQEVEKTMQAIGPSWKKSTRHDKSIEMLRALQYKILESVSEEAELEEYAYSSFNKSLDQIGFELLLRKQFADAQVADKGTKYNNLRKNIERVLNAITDKGAVPSVEIITVRIDLIIRWRLQKPRGPIEWELFRNDLLYVLESARYRNDPIKSFYLGLAEFHLGNIEQSNAIYSNLRRMQALGLFPHEIRAFALGPEGFHKRYQCTISREHGRNYAHVPELDIDIPVAGSSREIVSHTYIGFALNGTTAIFDKPEDIQMQLA